MRQPNIPTKKTTTTSTLLPNRQSRIRGFFRTLASGGLVRLRTLGHKVGFCLRHQPWNCLGQAALLAYLARANFLLIPTLINEKHFGLLQPNLDYIQYALALALALHLFFLWQDKAPTSRIPPSPWRKLGFIALSTAMAQLLLLTIPLEESQALAFIRAWPEPVFLAGYLLSVIVMYLSRLRADQMESFILYWLPPFAVFMVYYFAFYPAIMSSDSLEQWRQILNFDFDDWHPAFHSLAQYLITQLWHSAAAVSLAQILFTTGVFAYGMHTLKQQGAPKYLLFFLTLLFAIHPLHGAYSITLWKDIPFSVSLLWLSILLVRIATTEGRWLKRWQNLLLLTVVLTLTFFFRHNGFAPVLATLLGLFILYLRRFLQTAAVTMALIGIILFIRGPLFQKLEVKTDPPRHALPGYIYPMAGHIAAVIKHKGEIKEKEWQFLRRIHSPYQWRRRYDPYQLSYLMDYSSLGFIVKNKERFFKVWQNILQRNPKIVWQHTLKTGSLVWRITEPVQSYFFGICYSRPGNQLGLYRPSELPKTRRFLNRLIQDIQGPNVRWLFVRPALNLYLALFFALLLWLRTLKLRLLLPVLPLLANSLGIFVAAPVQDTRFMYAAFLLMPLMIAYFFITYPRANPSHGAQ